MHNFSYHRPSSLSDAAKALQAASDGKIVAGGMTLIPTLKQRLAAPSDLVDLAGIADLKGIKVDGAGVTIGATTPHAAVARSAEVKSAIPALAHLAESGRLRRGQTVLLLGTGAGFSVAGAVLRY